MNFWRQFGTKRESYRPGVELLRQRTPELLAWFEREIPARFRRTLSGDDLLQELWAALLRQDPQRVRDWNGWITAAAKSTLLMGLRRARALKRGADQQYSGAQQPAKSSYTDLFAQLQGPARTPSREVAAEEARQAVAVALAVLPADQRRAIYLHRIQGLARREVAEIMNRSEVAVGGLICRGLERLRACIGEASRFLSGSPESAAAPEADSRPD